MLGLALVPLVAAVVAGQERELGYGTKFGTEPGKAVPGRTVGLGAGPGPVGGGEGPLLEVLHRLELYRVLTGGPGLTLPGYRDNSCPGACPPAAHCSYGLCFCDSELAQALDVLEVQSSSNISAASYDASYIEQDDWHGDLGNCTAPALEGNETAPRLGEACGDPADCWRVDINSACSPAFTCICKPGTLYNKRLSRCELDQGVDCSSVSPDLPASPALRALAEDVLSGNVSVGQAAHLAGTTDSLLAYMDPESAGRNFSAEEFLEAFCRDVDYYALELATGDPGHDFLTVLEDTVGEVINTTATVLGCVVAIFLLLLALLCLAGCLCYCCLDSCKVKIKNLFAPTNYSEGLDNKAATGLVKDAEAAGEKDELEKAISGYQPVPQQPPASYPQGVNSLPRGQVSTKNTSLPRGASLPRNSANTTASLKRGISPIPKAYPALAEAPSGYPESPQKTGMPPLGFPQSPPEYPQTPTPPGFPANANKHAALYPAIPEK